MIESISGWYFVLGIITMVIGGYRNVKGKQSFDADELTALSWFLCWWVWLPYFFVTQVVVFFKKTKKEKLKF